MPKRVRTVPSGIRPLDPDANPWERQQGESAKAWQAFVAYRDSDERVVRNHGPSALDWSREWSWGYRAFEYDRFLDRIDVEEMVRYRRHMNKRHRDLARAAQQRLAQYLTTLNIADMKPSDVARWMEVAVKVERVAAGSELPDGSPVPAAPPPPGDTLTVADLLGVSGDAGEQADLALELHALIAQSRNGGRTDSNGHP